MTCRRRTGTSPRAAAKAEATAALAPGAVAPHPRVAGQGGRRGRARRPAGGGPGPTTSSADGWLAAGPDPRLGVADDGAGRRRGASRCATPSCVARADREAELLRERRRPVVPVGVRREGEHRLGLGGGERVLAGRARRRWAAAYGDSTTGAAARAAASRRGRGHRPSPVFCLTTPIGSPPGLPSREDALGHRSPPMSKGKTCPVPPAASPASRSQVPASQRSRHRPSRHPPPVRTRARLPARPSSTSRSCRSTTSTATSRPPSGSSGRVTIDHFYTTSMTSTATATGPSRSTSSTPAVSSTSPPHLAQGPQGPPLLAHRRRGRHRRRLAAAVGRVPRRADDRGDERAGPRRHGRGQPRVRRGLQGAAAPRSTAAASTTATARTTRTPARTARSLAPTSTYLAANVVENATGKTILPPYAIKKFNGAKIGFIGMTLEGTPNIVTASGVAGLEFKDEVETANALVPVLKAQGVNAIVVLLHEGGDARRRGPRHGVRTTTTVPAAAARSRGPPSSTSTRASTPPSTWSSRATRTSPTSARCPTAPASRASSPRRRRSVASTPTRRHLRPSHVRHRPPDDGRLGQQDRRAHRRQGRRADGAHRQVQGRSSRRSRSTVIGQITDGRHATANAARRVTARRPHRRRPARRPVDDRHRAARRRSSRS